MKDVLLFKQKYFVNTKLIWIYLQLTQMPFSYLDVMCNKRILIEISHEDPDIQAEIDKGLAVNILYDSSR